MNFGKYREYVFRIVFYMVIFLLILSAVTGLNMYFNNQNISTDAYTLHSYATVLSGHIEYVKYSDGSQEVKVYSWFGHRLYDSALYQDLNGDNKIDRIRRNAPELKHNKICLLLVREYDYEENKKIFDKADNQLLKLRTKYS